MIGRHRRGRYVTQDQLNQAIQSLREELMTTQADIDAVVQQLKNDETGLAAVQTAVAGVDTKLTAAQATLQAEIDKLATGNPTLDLSALQAIPGELASVTTTINDAATALGTHVDTVGALVPTPPAPPAAA